MRPKKSDWSRNAIEQWDNALSGYSGSALDSGQRLPLGFLPLPMFNNTEQNDQTNASEALPQTSQPAAADAGIDSSPSVNTTEAAENSQGNQLHTPPAPTSEDLAARANVAADANVVSPPAANNAVTAENGPQGSAESTNLPTVENQAVQANTAADPNAVSPVVANSAAAVQNNQLTQDNRIPFTTDHWTKAQDYDILNNTEKDVPYLENNIEIGRSVGAKAKNYDVMDLETGEIYHFAEGTKIQGSEVFAGKGTRNTLNIAPKYAHWHGGKVEDWQHAKGFAVLTTPDGDKSAEVHWMQCSGIGKFDFFIKE